MAFDEDKRLSPSMYFSAHCGFTYSNFINMDGEYNENKDLWYFGFDCNHIGDKQDCQKKYNYGLIDKNSFDYYLKLESKYPTDGEHRTIEYVENCLNKLADEFL